MRAMYINRKAAYIFGTIIGIILIISIFSQIVLSAKPKKADKPIYCVETKQKKVAISFDAAWGSAKTQDIMDIVKDKGANATFFLVGFWVDKYPELVREMDQRKFEVGNHSSTHPHMGGLSKAQIEKEIAPTNDKIYKLIGKVPTVFRPPYGDYSDCLVDTVREMGMHTIQWDVDSLDWKELGIEPMINTVIKKVKDGSIILFHNNSKYITEALPRILDILKERGYEIVSVSELIMKENYYVDIAGVQHAN